MVITEIQKLALDYVTENYGIKIIIENDSNYELMVTAECEDNLLLTEILGVSEALSDDLFVTIVCHSIDMLELMEEDKNVSFPVRDIFKEWYANLRRE